MLIFKQGRMDEAARLLDNEKISADDPINAILLSCALANMGMKDEAFAALASISARSDAKPIAHAVELQLQGRKSELLSFALQEQRRTEDPIWNGIQATVTALMGEYGAGARRDPGELPRSAGGAGQSRRLSRARHLARRKRPSPHRQRGAGEPESSKPCFSASRREAEGRGPARDKSNGVGRPGPARRGQCRLRAAAAAAVGEL
jgi:hypothetical protein